MEIKYANVDRSNHKYSFVFEGVKDRHQVTMNMNFYESWFFLKEDTWENVKNNLSCSFVGKPIPVIEFANEQKEIFITTPIYLPDALGRYIFKTCLDFFITTTGAPVKVDFATHPGFPLIVVTHNSMLMDEIFMEDLIHKILDAISSAEIKKELINTNEDENEDEDDRLENVDDAEIIDYEFNADEFKDSEVVARLNETSEGQYTPLEREDEND